MSDRQAVNWKGPQNARAYAEWQRQWELRWRPLWILRDGKLYPSPAHPSYQEPDA